MADAGNILVVIPARGGSKRLPRKNVLPLAGKPLICWTIEAALEARLNAKIVVTSDDREILGLAQQYESQGIIAHKRPDHLASDTAATASALTDVVEAQEGAGFTPHTIILLQPTSPLRNASDIVASLDLFHSTGCHDTVVSVCEVDHPTAWVGTMASNSVFANTKLSEMRSQEYAKEHRLNGAIYISRADVLKNSGSLFTSQLRGAVMSRVRSIDIDDLVDFKICESLINYYC